MNALRLVLPTLLLGLCLWKARTNRLFLLGIPLFMVMGESVFFDMMRPFWTPGRFVPQNHIMGWLAFAWLCILVTTTPRDGSRRGAAPFGPPRLLPEEVPPLLIGVLIVVHAGAAAAPAADLGGAVVAARDLAYLFIGYMLVRGAAWRFSRVQVLEFLGAAVIANTVAAALYVVHQGLGVKVYAAGEYFTTLYGGAEITRTFTFMPQLTLLALGFVLAKPRWTPTWLVVLGVTILSVLVSYTRVLLITVFVAIVLAVVVRELRRPSAARFVRRLATLTVSALVVVAVFAAFLPTQSEFLMTRVSEFAGAGGVSDIGNWQVREFKYTSVEDVVVKNDPLFGMGFPEPGSNAVDAKIYRYSSDMAWIPILYHTGYVGLGLFGLLLFGFGLRAFVLAMGEDEKRRYLGLTYLVTIALTAIVGFTAWVFMQPRLAPMGLWVLALVAAEALRPDGNEAADVEEVPAARGGEASA